MAFKRNRITSVLNYVNVIIVQTNIKYRCHLWISYDKKLTHLKLFI